MRNLTDYEKEKRQDSELYFKNGKPKKKYMLCRDPEYQASVRRINGSYCSVSNMCGGLSCPLYRTGCDNRGEDWC